MSVAKLSLVLDYFMKDGGPTMSVAKLSQDVLEHCLKIIRKVDELQEEAKKNKDFSGRFRARCERMPELMEDVGIISTLTYAYAKAGKDIYENVVKFMKGENDKNKADILKASEEDVGYALFLYATLDWLTNRKVLQVSDAEDVEEILKELSNPKYTPPLKLSMIMNVLRPMYITLKHLAEAKYK